MIGELRGGLLVVLSLTFFMIIVALFSLGMIMRPDRWSERSRPTS
jgi:hypothetical protein